MSSSDISASNNEYIKINKESTMHPAAFYGGSVNPRSNNVVMDPKVRTVLSQLPQKDRPDLSLMQHLVKQDIEFSISIKKRSSQQMPQQQPQRQQVSYIQPMPAGTLKHPQHMSFKRLQPAPAVGTTRLRITPSSTYDVHKNFNSVPDALEALKIPSPTTTNLSPTTLHYPIIQPSSNVYHSKILYPYSPPSTNRGSMSPSSSAAAIITAPNSRRLSVDEPLTAPPPKKRARTKNTPLIGSSTTTVTAAVEEREPPKKMKPRKPNYRSSINDHHSHSSSEPPTSSSTTTPAAKNNPHLEKSGTPTLNEDYTVRRSGRKVIKPAHLVTDIGLGHHHTTAGTEKYHHYDSTSTTVTTNALTAGGATENEDDKNYYECAAPLPELMEQMDLSKIDEEIKDLDEVMLIPKDMEAMSEENLKKYILACQEKVKCDAHIAFMHLASNEFDIKKAMESFDAKDSIPQTHLSGKDSAGIWSPDDLKTFVRLMNNNKCYKRMHKISKHTSNKSTANVVNAYYALKKDVCSFGREFTICPEIIKTQKPILGYDYVASTKCENCIKQLWNKSAEQEEEATTTYDAEMLCSLCKLYYILYGKLRPNAESTPSIFDDSRLTHDTCLYEMMKDEFDEVFIPDWNALKMNVYKVNSTQMKEFAEAIKDLKVDQNTQEMLTNIEKMNENCTYIFFSEKPLTNIPQFYPKNGIPLAECLTFTDPPPPVAEPEASKSPTLPPAPAAPKTTESDDENDGPPILINEMERSNLIKTKTVIEKPFDVFYFGYLDNSEDCFDENKKFHNEHGLEFHHAYEEKLQNFDGSLYLSFMDKKKGDVNGYKPNGCDDEKDKADKEMIEKYGNISFSTFSQTFIDSKKKFQTAAESLNVPLEYLEAYVRQNYYNLKIYFAQYERMVKTRARRSKGRNRAAIDEREKRPNYLSFSEAPKKRNNFILAL